LETARCAPWEQVLAGVGALAARAVVVTEPRKALVARLPVSVDDRATRGGGLCEGAERAPRGVCEDREAKPSRALATSLDRDPAERLGTVLATAPLPFLEPAEEELVDLDLAP
jgi:hypothetical protein